MRIHNEIREYYSLFKPVEKGIGYNLLDNSDELLSWLLRVFHGNLTKAPPEDHSGWDKFIADLVNHRIGPYLYYLLKNSPVDSLPPEPVLSSLKNIYRQQSFDQLLTISQVKEVTLALKEAGIPSLLVKGPALAYQVYPSPTIRESVDLDLLITPDDADRAIKAVQTLGFHIRFDAHEISKNLYHHQVLYPGPGIRYTKTVELHWRPLYLPGMDDELQFKDLFERSTIIQTDIGPVSTLSLPDALLYAATHMVLGHPHEIRLIWIADISLLSYAISKQDLWSDLVERSLLWNGKPALIRVFKEAELWFGLQIPEPYQDPSSWPEPSDNAVLAYTHADLLRIGEEIPVQELMRRMPTLREKMKAGYHYLTATRAIRSGHPNISRLDYLRIWVGMVRDKLFK